MPIESLLAFAYYALCFVMGLMTLLRGMQWWLGPQKEHKLFYYQAAMLNGFTFIVMYYWLAIVKTINATVLTFFYNPTVALIGAAFIFFSLRWRFGDGAASRRNTRSAARS